MKKKTARKVVQMGNSLGVGIPKEVIDALKIRKGDQLEFDVDKDGRIIVNHNRQLPDDFDPEMIEMVRETFAEYDDVFKNLKDR
ncbi:MAG TPA: AbrB/MazE/SpoVT family DNA-binding domain-containing protein [Bacillales bacterium]|nr:AbrB/MazE/SpoVT family DNA-binding domain-containing protein [Bacillales bacterium]